MTDEHAHGEDETDSLVDAWLKQQPDISHAEIMDALDRVSKSIEALSNEQPIIPGFVNTRSPFDDMDDDDDKA